MDDHSRYLLATLVKIHTHATRDAFKTNRFPACFSCATIMPAIKSLAAKAAILASWILFCATANSAQAALTFQKVVLFSTANSVRIQCEGRADEAGSARIEGAIIRIPSGQKLWQGTSNLNFNSAQPLLLNRMVSGLKPALWSPALPCPLRAKNHCDGKWTHPWPDFQAFWLSFLWHAGRTFCFEWQTNFPARFGDQPTRSNRPNRCWKARIRRVLCAVFKEPEFKHHPDDQLIHRSGLTSAMNWG